MIFEGTDKKRIVFKVVIIIMLIVVLHVVTRLVILNDMHIFSDDFLRVVFKEIIFSYLSVLILGLIIYKFIKNDLNTFKLKISTFAFTDGLTGLYNRHYLNSVLQKSLRTKNTQNSKTAIAFLDIDNFKIINDTYGHSDGDCILRCLSKVLKKINRQDDIVFRYGGEEFIIIFSNMENEDALDKVQYIVTTIESMDFGCINKKVTVSIGLSYASGEYELNQLLNNADSALYMAKNDGKNCVKVFN